MPFRKRDPSAARIRGVIRPVDDPSDQLLLAGHLGHAAHLLPRVVELLAQGHGLAEVTGFFRRADLAFEGGEIAGALFGRDVRHPVQALEGAVVDPAGVVHGVLADAVAEFRIQFGQGLAVNGHTRVQPRLAHFAGHLVGRLVAEVQGLDDLLSGSAAASEKVSRFVGLLVIVAGRGHGRAQEVAPQAHCCAGGGNGSGAGLGHALGGFGVAPEGRLVAAAAGGAVVGRGRLVHRDLVAGDAEGIAVVHHLQAAFGRRVPQPVVLTDVGGLGVQVAALLEVGAPGRRPGREELVVVGHFRVPAGRLKIPDAPGVHSSEGGGDVPAERGLAFRADGVVVHDLFPSVVEGLFFREIVRGVRRACADAEHDDDQESDEPVHKPPWTAVRIVALRPGGVEGAS